MADEYTDDFMDDEEEGGSGGPFLLIAGLLGGFLVLALICGLIFALSGRNGQQDIVAEIEMTNEAIAAQNLLVTQTVAAMQTEAARPTDTPTPTATPIPPTPTATPSPEPTETPVVQPAEDDNGDDDNGLGEDDEDGEDGVEEPVLEGTSIFSGGGVGVGTPTPVPGAPGATALPDTGMELWAVILGAFALLFILFAARRMRAAT